MTNYLCKNAVFLNVIAGVFGYEGGEENILQYCAKLKKSFDF